MTLWSSPHPKDAALKQATSTEAGKIKELADPGGSVTMPILPSTFSDGSDDAGFEDGSIDVDMGEDEADGIQIDCIQTLTEFEPIADGDLPGTSDSPLMSDYKTAIPLPAPSMQIGSAYGGNQAYVNIQNSLPRMIDRPSSPIPYWGSTSTESRHPSRVPGDVGLNNIGNTCFMNSGLQCLLHTSPLVEYFLDSEPFDRTITSLVYQFHSLMKHAWFGYTNAIALHDFKMVLGNKYAQFKDCRQHDCQEFLAVLLDMLHEELKLKNKAIAPAADSSVGESYIVDCTGSDKEATSTNKAHCSVRYSAFPERKEALLGNQNCVEVDNKDGEHRTNSVSKRLKLDDSKETEACLESTTTTTTSEEVKRKSATVKQENRSHPDSVARCSIDDEEELVDVENVENEAEVNNKPEQNSVHPNNNKTPVEKAQEYWHDYMTENNTVVASTFQGMFKSSVTCSECSFISETYEPFMYLSLPIPRVMEKQLNVTFVSLKDHSCTKVELSFHLVGTIDKLIQEVVSKVDNYMWKDGANYAAAEVVNHRVDRVLDHTLQLRQLNTNIRNLYVYELNDNFDDKFGAGQDTPDCPTVNKLFDHKQKTVRLGLDWDIEKGFSSDIPESTSTTTHQPITAPVGGGAYDTTAASSSFVHGVSSSSNDVPMQDNDSFNKVQCNICLEDYSRNDLKQHKGCSCVLCEECLTKSIEHFQTDDEDKSKTKTGSYVKCAVCLQTVEIKRAFASLDASSLFSSPPEFINVPVLFRNEPGTDANNNSSWTSGLFGAPWLIRVPSHVEASELVDYIENINPLPDANYRLLSVKSDGKSCGQCVFSSRCNGCELPREGMISLNSYNLSSIMISYTGLPSERMAEMQPTDMAIQNENEIGSSWHYNRNNEEPTIDIHDCLRTFSETEHLDEQNPWFCPRCKKNQRATKALSICRFPDYLIVYLKRFVFLDQSSNKLNNRLTFPVSDLDVSEYVTEGFSADIGKYNLYSCVCHFGSASVGHYTAFAKNPVTDNWHYFNDDTISERAPAETEHASAYVLFYEKQGMRRNIPAKCSRPLPELNSFNSSLSYNADTRGSYLPSESSISAAGPVRADGDFINEVNLQVDSTSSSFAFPHTSTEADLLALEVDEGVGADANQLLEIRDGLGLTENDSMTVSSSTQVQSYLDFGGTDEGSTVRGTIEPASSSTTNQNHEPSSSVATGGADSTSCE